MRSQHLSHTLTSTLLFHVPCNPSLSRVLSLRGYCRKPPTCAKAGSPPTTPSFQNKKPYGYWKHLPNVLSELEAHMSSVQPRPTTMPTAQELALAGRPDLAGAIRRHTWRKVAAAANLPLSSHARPRSLNLSFCTQIHTKRMRPHMYWRDWSNVEREIRQFIQLRAEQTGIAQMRGETVMPSAGELVDHGRSDLKRAISLHGGVWEVANRLGLVPKSRPPEYWNEEHVTEEVKRVMRCTGDREDFPTVDEMRQFGGRGLPSAVRRLGGARAVAKRMGLNVRRRAQKR